MYINVTKPKQQQHCQPKILYAAKPVFKKKKGKTRTFLYE